MALELDGTVPAVEAEASPRERVDISAAEDDIASRQRLVGDPLKGEVFGDCVERFGGEEADCRAPVRWPVEEIGRAHV